MRALMRGRAGAGGRDSVDGEILGMDDIDALLLGTPEAGPRPGTAASVVASPQGPAAAEGDVSC